MTILRRLPGLTAKLHKHPARREKGFLHLAGATACLLAIFISAGGHWGVLQSIAYTRMLVEFAQEDSLYTAVKKTFDDRYACPLCPKIRDGCNEERKVPLKVTADRMPEFLAESNQPILFSLPIAADVPLVALKPLDLSNAPPKPPPRLG